MCMKVETGKGYEASYTVYKGFKLESVLPSHWLVQKPKQDLWFKQLRVIETGQMREKIELALKTPTTM